MGKTLDTLIKEKYKEEYDNIVCPPKEEIWDGIITKLRKHRRQEKIGYITFGFIAGVLVVCVVVALYFHII